MRIIDLTTKLERKKHSVFSTTNVYLNNKYFGFVSKMGIGFIKRTRKGVRMTSNGRVRWYHTNVTDLQSALTSVRCNYGISIPSQGWDKVKIKHYNLSDLEQILKLL